MTDSHRQLEAQTLRMARLSPFAKDRAVFLKLAAEHRARAEASEAEESPDAPAGVKTRRRPRGTGRTLDVLLGRRRHR